MSGYADTPLIKKLGIKQGTVVQLLNPPSDYLQLLQPGFPLFYTDATSEADLIHLFVHSFEQLLKEFTGIISSAKPRCVIWISWYKKKAGIITDVTEDIIRSVVLPTGWVDVKVCSFSHEWSALKFVKRK